MSKTNTALTNVWIKIPELHCRIMIVFPVSKRNLSFILSSNRLILSYSLVEKIKKYLKNATNLPSKSENKYRKHVCYRNNNNPLWGENDRGSHHHSPSSSFHPQDVWTPEAADDWFLFYCFYFSFRRHFEWNHCPARLLDWKAPVPRRLWLIPTEPRGCGSNNRELLFPLTPDLICKRSSAASCRQVSSFPHDTAIMVPSGWHVSHPWWQVN